MLSNVDIRAAIAAGEITIEGLREENIQGASVDLTLGNGFLPAARSPQVVDPYARKPHRRPWKMDGLRVRPGELWLASTREIVTLAPSVAAQIAGKSSLARDGLVVHLTAGFIDPGFSGPITLEIVSHNPNPLTLTAGMPVCQLVFFRLDTPTDAPYNGKYQGATGPQESRYYLNQRPEERTA